MIRCYIGLGANLADPTASILSAVACLKQLPDSRFVALSSIYQSQPMGPADQPDYINAVAAIDTQLTPLALLDQTQHIEQHHGRQRKAERWGPRTLDLDILLYGDHIIENERLTIPHYGMKEREFVLYPLHDLAPTLMFSDGTRLADHLLTVPLNGMEKRLN